MRQPFIPIDQGARALIIIAYFALVIAALFGVAYGNFVLVIICLLSGFLGFVGLKYGDLEQTTSLDKTPISRKLDSVLKWVAIDMGAIAFADAFVPHFFSVQFLGFVIPLGSGISIDPSQFLTVGLVFTEAESVMEELLFRLGVVNIALRLRKVGQIVAALVSGFVFMLAHIPAYGLNLPVLIILGSMGAIFAISAMRTMAILTPMLVHMLNNAIAWFYQASIIGAAGALSILPRTPGDALLLGGALTLMSVRIFATRSREVRRYAV
jgi:membrane protease YdiL (CAAX protease family)